MKIKNFFNASIKYFICFSLIMSYALYGQSEKYAKVKVHLNSSEDFIALKTLNLDFDHYEITEDQSAQFIIPANDLDVLKSSEFEFEVIIEDYRSYYNTRIEEEREDPLSAVRSNEVASRFDYGSMGGFYTYSEIEEKMDEMSRDFPDLVTPKYSIGKSVEGRDIWAIKISDNPNVDEAEEAVYFDALHHAREPLSMAVTINFAFWLLENYETNDQVKYIVDHREIYIVPCVNPDGYEYNRQTDPRGGGLWRKNRQPISNSNCVGIDLNRNYSYEFAHDGDCASTDPCRTTYRGEAAFSEPEVQAVRDYIAMISPNTSLSIHSTAGNCLMPYGYDEQPPDFPIYSEWASDFLAENDYVYGVTSQMLGYTSCGTTRDYFHAEGVYCWTLEIDGLGFWPPESTIFDLVAENVYPLFYQAWIAGQYIAIQSHECTGDAIPGGSFDIQIEVKNKGLGEAPSDVAVEVVSLDDQISVSGDGSIGIVNSRTKMKSDNFSVSLDPSFDKEMLSLVLIASQANVETDRDTLQIPVGSKRVLFEDDAENADAKWINSGEGRPWGVSMDDSYDGDFAFVDSDNGNSEDAADNYFTISNEIDLTDSKNPYLEFFSKWSIDERDFVHLQISTNRGVDWVNLKTYEGSESWHQELFDLKDYIGETVSIRFNLITDFVVPGDGFYFDKISIIDYDPLAVNTQYSSTSLELFKLYPNPVNSAILIERDEQLPTEVRIWNSLGNIILVEILNSSSTIQVNHLAAGTYFVQIIDLQSGKMEVKKMIKT